MWMRGVSDRERNYYKQKLEYIKSLHFVKYNVYGEEIMDSGEICDDIFDFAVKEGFIFEEEHKSVTKKKVVSTFILTKGHITIVFSCIIRRKG